MPRFPRPLTRRQFVHRSAVGLSTLPLACDDDRQPEVECGDARPGSEVAIPEPDHTGLNVVLVTIDDLGWETLPAYGNEYIETPAIDRLVDEGVQFWRAYNPTSSCSASRATFITGQYPHTHGVRGLVHRHPEFALPRDAPTFVSRLADAGYRTGIQGKWHVSPDSPEFWGYRSLLNGPDAWTRRIPDASAAIAFVECDEGPFYLELNFQRTHLHADGTWDLDEEFWVDPEAVRPLDLWGLPDWPEIREASARYFSAVRRVDAMLGDVLTALDRSGLAETTLVVLTSDNGAPFPGCKKTLYDRGAATPLIMRWPGVLDEGRVVDEFAMTNDIAPTILDATGQPPLAGAQGSSWLGRLRGDAPRLRDAVFGELDYHADYIPTRSIRTERWHYLRNFNDMPIGVGQMSGLAWVDRLLELPEQRWDRPRPPVELYDVDADPLLRTNLAGTPEAAPIESELLERLREHLRATDDPALAEV